MERIVYVLGAGFSNPLGLPVMSEFLERAKDQFSAEPQRYAHFQDVFATIRELSFIKNYYNADLFNIEEILSILEMQDHLEGPSRRDQFVKFIRDVITHHTPGNKSLDTDGTHMDQLFGNEKWAFYGSFVAAILNCSFTIRPGNANDWRSAGTANPEIEYSVVTLNYDMILEKAAERMAEATRLRIGFVTGPTEEPSFDFHAPLAKLHGSNDSGPLIPPTWSKHLTDPALTAHWKTAQRVLRNATQIRIIGYSLPVADAYVKYLFKASVLGSQNLKHIDVLCRDRDGSIKKRFEEIIAFQKLRFHPGDIREYLLTNHREYEPNNLGKFNRLETSHKQFFN